MVNPIPPRAQRTIMTPKMKIFTAMFLLLSTQGFSQNSPEAILKSLVPREQKLLDAIAIGDKSVWKSLLDDSCFIGIEDGSIVSKEKQIEDLNPLPPAYKGMIKIIEPKLQLHENTAVLTFIDDEYLELYGQKIHTQYRQTDTWMKRDGEWKMIAMQLFEIPKNPPPVIMPEAVLSKYIGTYELSSDRNCIVTVDNGKLYAQKNNKAPIELLAETESVFFKNGDGRGRVIFIKNDGNGTYNMVERRAGEDVVWKQIKGKE